MHPASMRSPEFRGIVQELGVTLKKHMTTMKVQEPPARAAGIKVESVEQLVDKLKNEAKVI
eukprot:scaffold262743_cov31-Tisochrysis_lutea.AAC.2